MVTVVCIVLWPLLVCVRFAGAVISFLVIEKYRETILFGVTVIGSLKSSKCIIFYDIFNVLTKVLMAVGKNKYEIGLDFSF